MENQIEEKLLTQDRVLVVLTLIVFLATTYTSLRAYIFLLDVESTWTAKESTNLVLLLMLWLAGMIITSVLTAICKLKQQSSLIKVMFTVILVANWVNIGLTAFVDLSRPPYCLSKFIYSLFVNRSI